MLISVVFPALNQLEAVLRSLRTGGACSGVDAILRERASRKICTPGGCAPSAHRRLRLWNQIEQVLRFLRVKPRAENPRLTHAGWGGTQEKTLQLQLPSTMMAVMKLSSNALSVFLGLSRTHLNTRVSGTVYPACHVSQPHTFDSRLENALASSAPWSPTPQSPTPPYPLGGTKHVAEECGAREITSCG